MAIDAAYRQRFAVQLQQSVARDNLTEPYVIDFRLNQLVFTVTKRYDHA
ncbi:hypothetical protein [Sodalis sp.]